MFFNRKDFVFSCVLIILSIVFYYFSHRALPSRKIAQDQRQLLRHRVIEPERTVQDVHAFSKFEEVVKLKSARIVIADYDLIRRDFPHVKDLSNPQIDEWILDQVAYISKPQSAQTVVNTPISIEKKYRQAARPPTYGRALVYPMIDPRDQKTEIGLIDVKGAGALDPGQKDHGNGVATLGECIREYLYENLVRDVLDDANLPNKTVGSYAVIDAGFGVVHADGSSSPAGLYLRQAHHRVPNDTGWLDENKRMHLQSIFRRYGIDPNRNVQGTTNDDIYDFGHYVVKDNLEETVAEKQIPFHLWGYDKSIVAEPGDRWFYSKKDYPWRWSHELAESFANGKASRHDAWTHFENLVKPAREKLTTHRPIKFALERYSSSRDIANFFRRTIVDNDLFVLENIKHNLASGTYLDDQIWKNMDVLVQLTKSLELLPYDEETAKIHKKIVAKAKETMGFLKGLTGTSYPPEIKKLITSLSKNDDTSCLGMASGIIQH